MEAPINDQSMAVDDVTQSPNNTEWLGEMSKENYECLILMRKSYPQEV